jgi:hypothetical protein
MLLHRFVRLVTASLLTLLAALPAAAAPPEFETIPLAGTQVLPVEVCGFPIQLDVTGDLRIQYHYDQAGNLRFERITYVRWSATYTNLDTGESLRTVGPEPIKVTFHQDGSITEAHMGLILHIVAPGEGLVTADVGRIVFHLTADGEFETVFEAGIHEMQFYPAFCDILAA